MDCSRESPSPSDGITVRPPSQREFCNTIGTKRTNGGKRSLVRFWGGEADRAPPPPPNRPVAEDPERSLQLRRSTGILAFANMNCLAHRAKGLLHVRRFSASDHRCRGAPGHGAFRG